MADNLPRIEHLSKLTSRSDPETTSSTVREPQDSPSMFGAKVHEMSAED